MQEEVLKQIKEDVIANAKESGILASLTAAQMVLESGWLKSGLTVKANNAFGIKGSYNGAYYECMTKEYVNGKYVTVKAKFKKYPSLAESISDHSALLCKSRYARVKAAKEYKEACRAVKACGYATAPNYAESLISLIEKYKLYEWDKEAAAGSAAESAGAVKDTTGKTYKIGDEVWFRGGKHYVSATGTQAAGGVRKAGKAQITCQKAGAAHPWHLIGVKNGSNVYGWVDEGSFEG